jgi:cystathionine beta-synthase
MPAKSLLELIGNTPLLEITHLSTGVCRLFVKLENQNPAGSIKDRIGLSMIEAAERDGRLKPGGTIVEATAGNTGLGLALVASQKGYKLILVVPDKMAREKIFICARSEPKSCSRAPTSVKDIRVLSGPGPTDRR